MDDVQYMRKAISYASGTNPNIHGVRVGCVIVLEGEIIGYGRREFASDVLGDPSLGAGTLHAERVAVIRATRALEGDDRRLRECDLYTTIAPCLSPGGPVVNTDGTPLPFTGDVGDGCGITGPRRHYADPSMEDCTSLILDSGFKRVLVASPDPNPEIGAASLYRLHESGVDVVILRGLMEMALSAYNTNYERRSHLGLAIHKHRASWGSSQRGPTLREWREEREAPATGSVRGLYRDMADAIDAFETSTRGIRGEGTGKSAVSLFQ